MIYAGLNLAFAYAVANGHEPDARRQYRSGHNKLRTAPKRERQLTVTERCLADKRPAEPVYPLSAVECSCRGLVSPPQVEREAGGVKRR